MSQDKDELARRLAAMSESAPAPAADESHPAPDQPHDHVDLTATPPSPAPPPANAPRMIFPDSGTAPARTTPQPNPFVRPAPPPPNIPQAPTSSSARPGSPAPGVYYTPPTPLRQPAAAQSPQPTAPLDDDAVIVPAPDPAVFASRTTARRPPIIQHRVQTLAFKRTIIPILLTLGLLCPALALIGLLAPSTSPLSVLRSAWFFIPFILIGLLNLALAIVTMLQVRDELQRQQQQQP